MEAVKVVAVIALMVLAVYLASNQKWIDTIRETVFDLFVLALITAAGVKLVEWFMENHSLPCHYWGC